MSIELFAEGGQIKLAPRNTSVESFEDNGPGFVTGNFVAGWAQIVTVFLKKFVEK